MNQSTVSVIIPVYNGESTVEKCVESVLNQTWEALEVVAVDDGSADRSLALLRQMSLRDSRLKVFHKENGGVASARNLGLENATGTYVQFVDSDDELIPDATRRMVLAMEGRGCDLAVAPYTEVVGELSSLRGFIRQEATLSQREFLDRMSRHPNSFFYAVLWNKLYRREIVVQKGIRFDGRFLWGEDFDFNTSYYRYAMNVATLAEPTYFYNRKMTGLALDSVRQCLKHPLYSIKMKLWLQQGYDRLFRETGLYREYRWVLKRYLFGVTISG